MPRGDASAERVREHALTLFAEHGVAGTSLQMIADALGVTKAAVYFRYRTKDEIVRSVLAPAFDDLNTLLDEAEAIPVADRPLRLVEAMASEAVRHHRLYSVVLRDVTARQLESESPAHLETFRRLRAGLAGHDSSARAQVGVAMFLHGLTGAAVDPDLRQLGADDLERAIVATGRGILGLG